MKRKLIILSIMIVYLIITTCTGYGQENYSIFENKEGKYGGTISGILFLQRGDKNNKEKIFTILDFQGSKAELNVEEDPNQIYDACEENYLGFTTSGRSTVKYSTYATANEITLQIGDEEYVKSKIDGACEGKLEGIEAKYWIENDVEYLTLKFSQEIELNNVGSIIDRYNENNEKWDLFFDKNIKYAKILPDSFLVFCIGKNKQP